MAELTERQLQKITESVIFNYLALHFNNEVKHTSAYKHELKRDLNKVIKTLEKAEEKEFELIFGISEDTEEFVDGLSGTIMEAVTNLINDHKNYSMFIKANIFNAYVKDSKRMEGIANKILNK